MTEALHAGVSPALIDELVTLVRSRFRTLGGLRHIKRQRNDFSTKVESEFVTLSFDGEPPVRVLVKKAIDDAASRRPAPPDREIRVYERLGAHRAFAAPRFIGTIGGDDLHLVLAAIAGWDLRYHDVERWALAAGDLGRMHAAFHGDLDLLDDWLPSRDQDYYLGQAELAATVTEGVHTPTTEVLRRVAAEYEDLSEELAKLPATLVHGDLAPKNVLIDASETEERAVFVDWEWAAIGFGAVDLEDLLIGLGPKDRSRVVAAYVAAARETALPTDEAAITRSLELARLQRTMFRIARSPDWGVSAAQVFEWANQAASLCEKLTAR